MLETSRNTDAHELATERPIASYDVRAVYERLLASPFYSEKRHGWRADQRGGYAMVEALLLDVLVQRSFDPIRADKTLLSLRRKHQSAEGLWNSVTRRTKQSKGPCYQSEGQLLGLLLDARDPADLERGRARLRTTRLYNAGKKAWYSEYVPARSLRKEFFPEDQLLDAYIDACIEPMRGKNRLEELHGSALYDRGRGRWYRYVSLDDGRHFQSIQSSVNSELMETLILTAVDPAQAARRLEELRSSFTDAAGWWLDPWIGRPMTHNQLLAAFVVARLEAWQKTITDKNDVPSLLTIDGDA